MMNDFNNQVSPELLRKAVLGGTVTCVENLLNAGVRLDMGDHDDLCAVFNACQYRPEIFGLLLPHIPDPMALRDQEGWTLLHEAAYTGNIASVKLCLEHGADPNARSKNSGYTPLHRAADRGHANIIRELLAAGADPLLCSFNSGFSALHSAAIADNTECIEILIATDAVTLINTPDTEANIGKTPLDLAVSFLRASHIAPLVAAGALVNRIGNNGDAPLHQIMRLSADPEISGSDINDKRLHVARRLLDAGADVGKSRNGSLNDSPLHLAAKDAWIGEKMIALLLEYTNDSVDHRNAFNETPLHYAAREGTAATVAALLEAGADPNAATKTNVTPLYAAVCGNILKSTELLLAAGADPDAKTIHGFVPEQYSRRDSICKAIKVARARKRGEP